MFTLILEAGKSKNKPPEPDVAFAVSFSHGEGRTQEALSPVICYGEREKA